MVNTSMKFRKIQSEASLEQFMSFSGLQSRRKMRRLLTGCAFSCAIFVFIIALSNIASNDEISISSGYALDPLRNEKSLRVLLLGDTGGIPILETTWAQREVKKFISALAYQKDIQFVINAGDNIYFTGPTDEFDYRFESRFENVYDTPSLQIPWLTIAGNHDHFGNVTAEIEYTKRSKKWFFPSLFYKKEMDFNNTKVEFIMIDTIELCGNTKDIQNAGFVKMLQNESHEPLRPRNVTFAEEKWMWIEKNLNESNAEYLIVVGHYPIHSMSSHGPTKCLRKRLEPMLKKYNVNAYFSGHDHCLQHFIFDGNDGHQVHHIVSGAASRSDSSKKHIKEFSEKNLKYYYPKSFFSWSPLSQLGFRHGGVSYIEFGHQKAEFVFYDKNGKWLYSSNIRRRKLPKYVEEKQENLIVNL